MKKIFSYTFILLNSLLYAQNFSRNKALKDFEFLNQAVVNGHPIIFNPSNKININEIVSELQNLQKDSISYFEYSLLLGKALQKVGDIHTSVLSNPLLPKVETYFPVKLCILNENLYIVTTNDNTNIGKKVLDINGVEAQKIIAVFSNFKASDGGSTNFSQQYFNLFSQTLIARYFNYPKEYNIQTEDEKLILNASYTAYKTDKTKKKFDNIFSNNDNYFTTKDSIGILKMIAFNKNDKTLLTSTFNFLKREKINNLVIDLRGNLGGNRNTVAYLAKQIVDTTFTYSIIQPKLKPLKYLTSRGKFFYFLSKLKYNIGAVFKGQKSELGRKFVYKYQPVKMNYNGKIFVITDGFTASASTMLTSWLKQYSNATFVGSQAGGGYNGNGGGSFPTVQLPYSKNKIKFPVYRLVLDEKSTMYQGIIPDIQPLKTINDIIIGKDIELETIIKIINPN